MLQDVIKLAEAARSQDAFSTATPAEERRWARHCAGPEPRRVAEMLERVRSGKARWAARQRRLFWGPWRARCEVDVRFFISAAARVPW